ncbi:hypothetical protein JYU34_004402 [Plutella xylostella]|uniref:Uncharacterized protein n=1 Tax=Plutella xylostella TaxID=51655 RepID=A0ABQ7QXW4_PLUXY|nr:hypothetical protein JYU34_004402 [Plutella xylostella]
MGFRMSKKSLMRWTEYMYNIIHVAEACTPSGKSFKKYNNHRKLLCYVMNGYDRFLLPLFHHQWYKWWRYSLSSYG